MGRRVACLGQGGGGEKQYKCCCEVLFVVFFQYHQNPWFRKNRFKNEDGRKPNLGGRGLGYSDKESSSSSDKVSHGVRYSPKRCATGILSAPIEQARHRNGFFCDTPKWLLR